MWKRFAAAAVALGMAQALSPSPSGAQSFDHLKCYRIKDPGKFEATANLVPLEAPPFAVESGCTIKVRGTKLCVPVTKELQSTTAPSVQFPAPALQNDFICYKMKCPRTDVADLSVTDQFGTRTVSGFVAKEICAPAVQGTPPPFTCTAQTVATCGMGSCPQGQSCAANLMTLACECQDDGGGSTTTTLPAQCTDQTIATCAQGNCPAGQTCQLNLAGLACACQ